MNRAKQRRLWVVIPVAILGIFVLRQITAMFDVTMVFFDLTYPWLVSSRAVARNLSSDHGDIVYDSLDILAKRKDPIAVDRAIQLLHSDDDYTWLNAALYLGACGREEAVPFLIKGLRHYAWRALPDIQSDLLALTSKNYGDDYHKWRAWWEQTHPAEKMDWETHLGFPSRAVPCPT